MTRHRPAGATSTGDGEPLPGAEKKEAMTRHRPAGATSTGDGEPLPGAEKKVTLVYLINVQSLINVHSGISCNDSHRAYLNMFLNKRA